jgi:hypothetical protein
MNPDPLKNSCSAPEEDYEDKDWEAREAQVKAQVAALQQQGQLPVDTSAHGLPVLQAPLAMYSSGLAGAGRRGLTAEARRKKRGKPEGAAGGEQSGRGRRGGGGGGALLHRAWLAATPPLVHCTCSFCPPLDPPPQGCRPSTSPPTRTSWRRWRWRCSTSWWAQG